MRKPRFIIGVLSTVALLAAASIWSVASAQQAGTTWTVWAGHATQDQAILSNDFQPRPLEINVGDTIVFMNGGFHTVAMGRDRVVPFDPRTGQPNPVAVAPTGGNTFDGTGEVDSGFMQGPAEFRVTFTAPGTFRIVCDIHVGMNMDLTVRPAGQPVATTPEAALAAAIDHFHRLDFVGRALPMILNHSKVTTTTTPDGATVHQLAAGFGDGHVEGTRFLPQSIVVDAGDWVRWVNPDPDAPHTVTFFPGGMLPDPNAPPPPPEALPPGFPFAPAGGNVYSGRELINSGAMFGDPRFAAASIGDSFTMQFTTPGTYQYVCIFHIAQGMVGTVTVLPAGGK